MTRLTWITLACAAALGGCSLMPAYQQPAAPVPGKFAGDASGVKRRSFMAKTSGCGRSRV